jgi:hypothetical protein
MKQVKLKEYPLSIWTWRGVYAASWGHHDQTAFLRSLSEDHGVDPPSHVVMHRGFARIGFGTEEPREVYYALGPGRGVRPITEIEW